MTESASSASVRRFTVARLSPVARAISRRESGPRSRKVARMSPALTFATDRVVADIRFPCWPCSSMRFSLTRSHLIVKLMLTASKGATVPSQPSGLPEGKPTGHIIGVDVGGTRVRAAVADVDGVIETEGSVLTDRRDAGVH